MFFIIAVPLSVYELIEFQLLLVGLSLPVPKNLNSTTSLKSDTSSSKEKFDLESKIYY